MSFTIREYPSSRVATSDVGVIGRKKHHIVGLVEADVTVARQRIREAIQSGQKIGFSSWIVKLIADTIVENKSVHAINFSRKKQVLFSDVDISIPIEREVRGMKVPLVGVIRSANTRSLTSIHEEIQAMKRTTVESEIDYVLAEKNTRRSSKLFFGMPQWIRLIVWKILLRTPFSIKRNIGTAMVTNVGMTGNFSGWIIPRSIHDLCIGLESICRKPWVHDGRIEIRNIFNLTILVDHDVVDRLPAAKFTLDLVRRIEQASGL